MASLGTRFKTVSTGEITLMMRYLEMRYEIKNLLKAEHAVIKGNKQLNSYMQRHNIEDAQANLKKGNEDAEKGFKNAYKLMSNDMICLRVMAKIILDLQNEDIGEEKMLEHEKRKKSILSANEIEALIKELQREREKNKTGSKSYSAHLLRKARLIVNGLYNLCKGKMDSAFAIRNELWTDNYFILYFGMRWEARGVRRDLKTEGKMLNSFKKHESEIKKHLQAGGKDAGKKIKHGIKSQIKDEEKFMAAVYGAFKDVLKIFMHSTLLFEKIIITLKREEHELDDWGVQHEIPLAMKDLDKQDKQKLLRFAEQVLSAMNTDLIQLSTVFNQ